MSIIYRLIIAHQKPVRIDESIVEGDASFVEDLRADSIQLVELILRLEEKGITIPMEAAWDVETVGDAYTLYPNATAQPRGVAFS